LVSIVDDEDGFQVVHFSHFSVKERPRRRGCQWLVQVQTSHGFIFFLEPAHTILAKACLGVPLRLGELVDEDNVEDKFPLARYAAEYWVGHGQFQNVTSHILREGMGHLFDPDKPHFAAWLQVHDIDTEPPYQSILRYFADLDDKESNSATPLYYAALCGFHDLANSSLSNTHNK